MLRFYLLTTPTHGLETEGQMFACFLDGVSCAAAGEGIGWQFWPKICPSVSEQP